MERERREELRKKIESDAPAVAWSIDEDDLLALLAAADRAEELQASLDRLHGVRFSDRCYHALKGRAETAEHRAERMEAALRALVKRLGSEDLDGLNVSRPMLRDELKAILRERDGVEKTVPEDAIRITVDGEGET